jgi:oligo-1,6-glucosidase/alpha-glucosidase
MMARGVPFTYMGEEIGMEELFIPFKDGLDPLAQKYKWVPLFLVKLVKMSLNRDGCRTPMQWDKTQNAGFSSTKDKTWLPVNDNYKRINVDNQIHDGLSLLNTYKQLLSIRKKYDAVRKGDIEIVKSPYADVLIFKRTYLGDTLYVALNLGEKTRNVQFEKKYEKIYSTGSLKIIDNKVVLGRISGIILIDASNIKN